MWIVKGRKGDASVLGNLGELREGSVCDVEYKVARGSTVERAWALRMGMSRASLGKSIRTVSEI